MSSEKVVRRYIYNLPYPEKRELEQLLDADEKWEELGGRYMEIKQIELDLIGKAVLSRESPTSRLLLKFGQRNGTIDQLFIMLSKMEHYRAMKIIIDYVTPKYHHLLQDNLENASGLYLRSSAKASPYPSAPNQHLLSIKTNSQPKETRQESAAVALLVEEEDADKFEADPSNFNHPSQATLPSKLPGMAANHNYSTKTESTKKMVSLNQESVTYNISSENGSRIEGAAAAADKQTRKISNGVKKLNIPVPTDSPDSVKKHSNPGTSANTFSTDDLPSVMKIPHKDILRATDNFEESRIIGRGGFGIVYKGEWKKILVAIKRLQPKNRLEAGDTMVQQISLNQSLTELKILNSCRIDNILPLYGVSLDGPEPCLVYQYMQNGSLEDRLLCKGNTTPLNWFQRSEIADGTAKGLNYLHTLPDKPLVHGDIKSANILLDANMQARIGDFGLAREGPASQYTHLKVTSIHGTQVYLPPEYLRQYHLSPEVDVYSYGIVLLEIATGQRAVRQKNKLLRDYVFEMEETNQIESLRDSKAGQENGEWFEELIKMGQKCSQTKKSKRPGMSEVLQSYDQTRKNINMTAKIRRLSQEMTSLPDSSLPHNMTPMEIQLWYDIRNGPHLMAPPDHQHFHQMGHPGSPLPPLGAMGGGLGPHFDQFQQPKQNFSHFAPNFNRVPLNITPDSPPPTYSSFHPSQIREPPSLDEHCLTNHRPPLYSEAETSCVATAGSSNYEAKSIPPGGSRAAGTMGCNSGEAPQSYSSGSVPILTMLGTKLPSGGLMLTSDDLGSTPHPSGVLSDDSPNSNRINSTNDVVHTPRLNLSDLNLGLSDSEED